jgi:GTPase SAR1 family protein
MENPPLFRIAMYGPYCSGKWTLLRQMSRQLRQAKLTNCRLHFDGLAELLVDDWDPRVLIRSATGALIYKTRMVPFVLDSAKCVIYVIAARQPEEYVEEDIKDFQQFSQFAKKLNANWDAIPWILVFNKIDRGTYSGSWETLPLALRSSVVRTNALTGEGVAELVERIKGASGLSEYTGPPRPPITPEEFKAMDKGYMDEGYAIVRAGSKPPSASATIAAWWRKLFKH